MTDIIECVFAREIYDSRGNPTVEVEVKTGLGVFRAGVPSGASTGSHEAVELRDGDASVKSGKGVSKAIAGVKNEICPALKGMSVLKQNEIDAKMIALDGTENKARLGANAMVGVSMAVCRAGAASKGVPLYEYIASLAGTTPRIPVPSLNVLNGGCHAGNKLAIQEFMIMPTGASSFSQAMQMASETYHCLKGIIKGKYGIDATNVGDEGGFAPCISDAVEAFELVTEAIKKAGYCGKIKIGFDSASSEFFKDGKYDLDFKTPGSKRLVSAEELSDLYVDYIKKYPVVFIEDPYAEDDWGSWTKFMSKIDIQCVADDLTVTNSKRIQRAIDEKCADCLLLKVNQIGTISESIKSANLATSNGWGILVSHRSGETEDSFIADLVVGLGCGQIKTGAPCRSERLAKYNQILRIEEQMGSKACFVGENFRHPK